VLLAGGVAVLIQVDGLLEVGGELLEGVFGLLVFVMVWQVHVHIFIDVR
jgi:hypothetical protein